MKRKANKLRICCVLTQLIIAHSLQAMGSIEFFSNEYLPVELQKHILNLSTLSAFQDNPDFNNVLNKASDSLKNISLVNKSFRSFKNDLIESFLEQGNSYLGVKYSNLNQDQKNDALKEALTGEKTPQNITKALGAVFAGADINQSIETDLGTPRSLLSWAVLYPSPELTRLLLIKGAQIDFQNINGYTALMQAASQGYLAIVKILLDHKANKDLLNDDKQTALDLVREKLHASKNLTSLERDNYQSISKLLLRSAL